MKNKLNRILILSLVFISFIQVDAIETNKINNSIHLKYEVKEKEEVLVENKKIFEFYESNYKELKRLIAEQKRQEEIIKEQKRLALKSELIAFSKQFVGNPYVLGGNSLTNGTDCSGFVMLVYLTYGYNLPRTTSEQSVIGTEVSIEEIEVGDIVSYGYNGFATHSALYIGDGMIIHASTPEGGIRIDNMYIIPIQSIRRVI